MNVKASHFTDHLTVCSNAYPGQQKCNHQSSDFLATFAGNLPVTKGLLVRKHSLVMISSWWHAMRYWHINQYLHNFAHRHVGDLLIAKILLTGHMCWLWYDSFIAWWRHQMETFSALLALSAGNSSVTDEFPTQRPVTRSFDVFLDLHLEITVE